MVQKSQPTTLTTLTTSTDDKQSFLVLVKAEQHITIKQSLASDELIYKQENKVEVIQQIVKAISFFLKVTGKEMEPFQIQILAGDLYEKFKCETFEDIVLTLKMARMGDFGKVYKVDSFVIMEWANKYLDKKAEEREKQYTAQKNAHKKIEESGGKFFHQLPRALQEKFNNRFKKETPKNKGIKEFLTTEKHRDSIKKAIEKESRTESQ